MTSFALTFFVLEHDNPSTKRIPILQHNEMYEKSISEHVGIGDLNQRTTAFTQWLLERPEQRIVVVGHSAFFRDLLQLGKDVEKMDNCEIRKVKLSVQSKFHSAEIVAHGGNALLPNNTSSAPL